MKKLRTFCCALVLAAVAGWLAGCASDGDLSPMPWDTPQGWEGPLPSTINQGR
ncbi:MAG TPA: hypothetical protein VGR14_07495 [Verrucomicrobiae bacterium]|nr:hypothetical protein [Verrucomicrobiae bacterium]